MQAEARPERADYFRTMMAMVAAGIVLRLMQYLPNPSLFIDEAMLAANIIHRTPLELVASPLKYAQAAPPLFLLATKAIGASFGYGEYALRATALVSAVAALFFFVKFARMTLTGFAIPLAVLLFALSPTLVKYAAEVKQYSTDTLAAIVLTIVAIRLVRNRYSRRDVQIAVVTGIAVVWFSQASVIVLAGLGLALASLALLSREGRAIRMTLVVGVAWALAAVAATLWAESTIDSGTKEYFTSYWSFSFMPFPPDSAQDLIWPFRILRGLYWNALNLWGVASAALIVAMWGLVSFWRRGRADLALLLAMPVIVVIALSAARLYPFSGRLVLFILPALVLALAEGAHSIVAMLPERFGRLRLAVPLVFAIPAAALAVRDAPPWYNEEMRPLVRHLLQNRQPGDAIYVSRRAEPAMQYYAPRFGLGRGEWIRGTHDTRDPRDYMGEVNGLAGMPRVWLIFSHDDVVPPVRAGITRHLDSVGTRLDSAAFPEKPRGSGSQIYLYDLR